jgi:putative DNA methylase
MKLIERWLPTEYLSIEAGRERGARFPPLFWLHIWWARRPLIGMRAVIAASLVDADGVDERRRGEFLRAIWLKVGNGRRKESSYPGQPERPAYNYNPLVDVLEKLAGRPLREVRLLDVFAGGGSIPFEALRLGVGEVVAVEYNPVAYVILKAVLEYPMRYGQRLANDVEKWARWMLNEAKKKLAPYFPRHPEGNPTNYIWVRVYRCPIHGVDIPAVTFTRLSEKRDYGLRVEYSNGGFKLKLVEGEGERTYERGLRCPKHHIITPKELAEAHAKVMETWDKGDIGHQPAVLAAVKLDNGKYVEPTPEMIQAYQRAVEDLRQNFYQWLGKYIPDQKIPEGDKTRELLRRGLDHFYKLFNARQLLVHATVVQLIREAYAKILQETNDPEYAKAVVTYLALAHGKLLDYNSVLTQWDPTGAGSINHTFDRHDFQVGQDFGEGDMITEETGLLDWVLFSSTGVVRAVRSIVELLGEARRRSQSVRVLLGDASDPSLYADLGVFDVVVTDPPYYGNVNYGELSDYFYVWMRLSIGDLYPEAFSGELVPKEREIVVNETRGCDEGCFERRLGAVFENLSHVLREDGLLVVVYGHRSFEGLRAMFRGAFDAGFMVTALWGFASEMPRSLHVVGKAAIRSNMVVVFRRRQVGGCTVKPGFTEEVMKEAADAFAEAYSKLGLSLVDALMAANSAGFKVVSRCWPLYTPEGQLYPLDKLEDLVERAVALAFTYNVLGGEVDGVSLVYLIARGIYGEPSYDDLRRLAAGLGFSHDEFIKTYCGRPRESKGEPVFPVLSLLEVKGSVKGRLVDALAAALRAASGGAEQALKRLEEFGVKLGSVVCRYVEQLRQAAENRERELLGVIEAKCPVVAGEKNMKPSAGLDGFF